MQTSNMLDNVRFIDPIATNLPEADAERTGSSRSGGAASSDVGGAGERSIATLPPN